MTSHLKFLCNQDAVVACKQHGFSKRSMLQIVGVGDESKQCMLALLPWVLATVRMRITETKCRSSFDHSFRGPAELLFGRSKTG